MDTQTLIDIARQATQAAEAEKAAKRQAQLAQRANELARALTTEVWQFLHMDPAAAHFVNSDSGNVQVDGWIDIDGETVPCYVTTQTYTRGPELVLVNLGVSTKLDGGAVAVGQAIIEAQQELAERRCKHIKRLENRLASKWNYGSDERIAAADADASELITLVPERQIEWRTMLAQQLDWAAEEAQEAQEAEEKRQLEERRNSECAECVAAFAVYRDECHAEREGNSLWTDQMQQQADVPFDVAKLTYAIAATDDDGDPMIDTQTVYVVLQDSYPGDWFLVYPSVGLNPTRRQYRHVVSIEQPVTLQPTSRKVYQAIREAGHSLLIGPATPQEVIDQWRAGLVPMPKPPAAPNWMSDYERCMIADEW